VIGQHMRTVAQQQWAHMIRRRLLLLRMGKFSVVGGLGTLMNTGILVILYHQLHVALVAASAAATELAIAHNFLWNNFWTFGRRGLSLSRFARFNVVCLSGQCLTILTLWLLVRYAGVEYLVANLVGIFSALVWNFTVSVHWTWGSG
jgi:dolichol-phosphate mannosyltransferase